MGAGLQVMDVSPYENAQPGQDSYLTIRHLDDTDGAGRVVKPVEIGVLYIKEWFNTSCCYSNSFEQQS